MDQLQEKLDKPIEFLRLPDRTYNALVKAGLTQVRDVCGKTEFFFSNIQGIGKLGVDAIRIAAGKFLNS